MQSFYGLRLNSFQCSRLQCTLTATLRDINSYFSHTQPINSIAMTELEIKCLL